MILKKELLLLEQVNQWLGVLGITYGMEVAKPIKPWNTSRMHD